MELFKKGILSIYGLIALVFIFLKPMWFLIEVLSNVDFVSDNWPQIVKFLETGLGTFATVILGFCILGWAIYHASQSQNKSVIKPTVTNLTLSFPGNSRTPTPIKDNNIFRWYVLSNAFSIQTEKGAIPYNTMWTIVLIFNEPINIKFLHLNHNISNFPQFEVKDTSQKHAIISIGSDFNGQITIDAEQ